jgi:hypothetical protein
MYEERSLLVMLSDRLFHSPEISEYGDENPNSSVINIYDLSWRSDEV